MWRVSCCPSSCAHLDFNGGGGAHFGVAENGGGVDAERLEVGLGQLAYHRPLQHRALANKALSPPRFIMLLKIYFKENIYM